MHRDEVDRRGPIRNPAVQGPTSMLRDLVNGGPDVPQQTAQPASEAVQGAVEDAVATAYTVIEQYMNRGQSAASSHYRSNGDRTMPESPQPGPGQGWVPPFGGAPGSGFGSNGGPWGPFGMLMEPWMQMMRLWTDSMSSYGGGGPMNAMNPFSTMMGMGGNPGVSIEVHSARPTRVTLDLAPGADFQPLSVGPLRNTADSTARLNGVEISSRPGHYTVRLTVSEAQAPGVYVGMVANPQGNPLGDLSVAITGPESTSNDDKKK